MSAAGGVAGYRISKQECSPLNIVTGAVGKSRTEFKVAWFEASGHRDHSCPPLATVVAPSERPMHIAQARKRAEDLMANGAAYLARTGERWEIVQRREKRAAREAAKSAALLAAKDPAP